MLRLIYKKVIKSANELTILGMSASILELNIQSSGIDKL